MVRSAIQRVSLAAVLALEAAGAQEYRPVTAVIDPALGAEAATAEVEALGAALSDADYVDLDLRVALAGTGSGSPRVALLRKGADPVAPECADGFGRIDVAGATLEVFVTDIHTHLILSLRFDAEDAGVGHTVACAGIGSQDGEPGLAITGRFYVSVVAIPTANDIQLVAVTP